MLSLLAQSKRAKQISDSASAKFFSIKYKQSFKVASAKVLLTHLNLYTESNLSNLSHSKLFNCEARGKANKTFIFKIKQDDIQTAIDNANSSSIHSHCKSIISQSLSDTEVKSVNKSNESSSEDCLSTIASMICMESFACCAILTKRNTA